MSRFCLKIIFTGIVFSTVFVLYKVLKAQENNSFRCHQFMENIDTTELENNTFALESQILLGQALIQCTLAVNPTAVQQLLDMEANPNIIRDTYGNSLLNWVALHNHLDLAIILLGYINPNMQSQDGVTALIIASEKGHLDIVTALLEANAVTDIPDSNGDIALSATLQALHLGQYDDEEHRARLIEIINILRNHP